VYLKKKNCKQKWHVIDFNASEAELSKSFYLIIYYNYVENEQLYSFYIKLTLVDIHKAGDTIVTSSVMLGKKEIKNSRSGFELQSTAW